MRLILLIFIMSTLYVIGVADKIINNVDFVNIVQEYYDNFRTSTSQKLIFLDPMTFNELSL